MFCSKKLDCVWGCASFCLHPLIPCSSFRVSTLQGVTVPIHKRYTLKMDTMNIYHGNFQNWILLKNVKSYHRIMMVSMVYLMMRCSSFTAAGVAPSITLDSSRTGLARSGRVCFTRYRSMPTPFRNSYWSVGLISVSPFSSVGLRMP